MAEKEYKKGTVQENIFPYQEEKVLTLHGAIILSKATNYCKI